MTFNQFLDDITVYEAGKPIELVVREFGVAPEDVVKLASNENPYGASPMVIEAVQKTAGSMFLYPDDSMYELKDALAERFSITASQIIIGAGSDQVLEFATRAKLNPGDTVLMNSVTFAMYEIYARQCGAEIVRTTFRHHHVDEFLSLYAEHRPKIVFLCLPNNPTGDALTKDEVYQILDGIDSDTLAIVDGAYMEYAAFKDPARRVEPNELINNYPNALYLGTFSKAYGLGGMRVGYGIGHSDVINALYKLRPPFNITTLSLKAGIEALKDEAFVQTSIAANFKEMERYERFGDEYGIEYIDSYTNFITYLLGEEHNSTELADYLLRRGVIVRNLASYGLNALRITVGTRTQNDRFFALFAEALACEK